MQNLRKNEMILNMINIEGPIGEEKDWIFYFTINDSNNNLIKSYENGIKFSDIWKQMDENLQKQMAFKLIFDVLSDRNI
jgi:hypothetical protein